ncbi:MAG: acyl-CoA reductase [Verrucomicrobiia bacterium]
MKPLLKRLAKFLNQHRVWPDANEKTLSQLIKLELGHADILSKPCRINKQVKLRAHAPKTVLLICAGNLSVAVWQIFTRLTLLNVKTVYLKPPTSPYQQEIKKIAQLFLKNRFVQHLHFIQTISDATIQKADAVIVYGNDSTLETFRKRVIGEKKKKRFLGYGHKLSCGIIFSQDINPSTAQKVVTDFLTYNQEGCLSPHLFYVLGNVDQLACLLSQAIKKSFKKLSLPPLTSQQKAQIYLARQEALLHKNKVFTPTDDLNITLIVEKNSTFKTSCLHRVLHLKPARNLAHVTKLLAPIRPHLSTVSMSRVKPFDCGAARFCPIGQMQFPSLFWKQDGFGTLSELVTWETIE